MTLLTSYHKYITMNNQLEVHTMSNHKRTESHKSIWDDGTSVEAPASWVLVLIVVLVAIGVILS